MLLFLLLFVDFVNAQSTTYPQIHSKFENVIVSEKTFYQKRCENVSAAQPYETRWTKNGKILNDSLVQDSSLTLNAAAFEDSAIYRCLVKNRFGSALSAPTKLIVAYIRQFASTNFTSELQANIGGFVIFSPPTLDAVPREAIRWQWTFQDQAIFSNLTHFVSTDGKLVVMNVQLSNAGRYFVEAFHTSLNQRVKSSAFSLTVTENFPVSEGSSTEIVVFPQDFTFPDAIVVKSFDHFVLECVAVNKNLVNVQILWLHNDTAIVPDGVKYQIEEFNRRLIVRNPSALRDGGVYSCEARVAGAEISSSRKQAWITVNGYPQIKTVLQPEIVVGLGQRFELPCISDGAPAPSIRWYFNGVDVRDNNEFCCGDNSSLQISTTGSLVFRNINDNSVGVYQCESENAVGIDFISTYLRTESDTPIIISPPTNVSALSEQSVTLRCEVKGSPPPRVKWQYNGSDIVEGNEHYRISSEGSLTILSATVAEIGWYTCVGSNNIGETQARAFVHVAGKTQIVNGPVDQSVIIGSNVAFACEISQEKNQGSFVRQWYFKNQLLTPGAVRNIEMMADGRLIIRQVGPSNIGLYTCTVTSPSGTQNQTGHLLIIEKPGMPLYVKAQLMNGTLPIRVQITWAEGFDGNSPIIKYSLEQRSLGAQDLWSDWETAVESIGKDQHSVIVDNLKPSGNYEFRVLAINRFGPGLPSQPSNNITMPQQPPAAAPRSVAGSARSSSSIMVQWQPPPPDQWNGDILGYIVRYRLANYPDIPWIFYNVSDVRSRNILLEDLITWREYECQVAAFNDRGKGVFSKSLYITTLEGVPAEPPLNVNATVINSTAIFVSLTPPPQQMVPGVNLGYKIEAWRGPVGVGNLFKTVKVLPYSLSRIETVVNGLGKFVKYNITTVCFTSQGDGPRSQRIEVVTKQDIPDPVKNLRLEEVLFDSVKLVWDKPDNPNGVLTNYSLTYWIANNTDSRISVALPPNSTFYRVQGLSPSTKYVFNLFASTEMGPGQSRTVDIVSGVPPELPGPPTTLTVSNIQTRSATLQFVPGFDGKTLISKWIVEAQVGASTNWTEVFNISAPDAKSIAVIGLRPFTDYKFRLIAENVKGRSSPSDPPSEKFQTLQAPPEHPPLDLDAQPISFNTIKLTWTPLPLQAWNGVPKGYTILYKQNGSSLGNVSSTDAMNKIIIEDIITSEYELTKLDSYTAYDIQMYAAGEVGQSQFSPLLLSKTYEGVPSSSVANFYVKAKGPTSMRATWQSLPPTETHGAILGYKMIFKADGLYPHDGKFLITGADTKSYELLGLMPYTVYKVSICAFTIVGDGPFKELSTRTDEDIPGPPSELIFAFVSLSELRITWRPPYHSNGMITHYSVAYWPNSTDQQQSGVKTNVNPDLRVFVATGVTSNTLYAFSISAETSVGWGPESRVLAFTSNQKISPSTPNRPLQSTAHPQSSTQLTILIDNSTSQTEQLRYYDVEYQQVNGDQWRPWFEKVSGISKYCSVSGLTPNTAYRFRIRSTNDFGESRWSSESDWIPTLEAEPSAPPTKIQIIPVNGSVVRVSWTPPELTTWNSNFVGYRVLYKLYDYPNETFRVHELPYAGSDQKIFETEISGFEQFRHYLFQMQTFNQQGSSPSSSGIFVFVGHSLPKHSVSNFNVETLSSTQIRLTWDVWGPEQEQINGFKIIYHPVGAAASVGVVSKQDIVSFMLSQYVLSDLRKFTNYSIEIAPFNRAGRGPVSILYAMTSSDRPGPVGPLVFTDIQLDSVNVSWAPPIESNGIILGYVIAYKTYKLDEEYIQNIQEKTIRNFLPVSNLEENITSTFSVQAKTVVGEGPIVTGKVAIGPQPGSPPAPSRPRVYPSEHSVTLEWEKTSDGKSPITSYIIQNFIVESKRSRMVRREALTVPVSNAIARWITFTLIENPKTVYTISYSQLEPSAVHKFRVVARNQYGVSYPSAESESITVPEAVEDKPFYLQWWFLVILALASLMIIVIIVAVLYTTGRDRKFDYNRKNSMNSINLVDDGVVTYELRASQKKNRGKSSVSKKNQYIRHPPPRPSSYQSKVLAFGDDAPTSIPGMHKVSSSNNNMPSFYETLNGHTLEPRAHDKSPELDTSTTADNNSDSEPDKDVSSIVQHYQTSDLAYRETWRRAAKSAQRPDSYSSHSENASMTGASPIIGHLAAPVSRTPMPAFSSFV